jgi:hypothetical protein
MLISEFLKTGRQLSLNAIDAGDVCRSISVSSRQTSTTQKSASASSAHSAGTLKCSRYRRQRGRCDRAASGEPIGRPNWPCEMRMQSPFASYVYISEKRAAQAAIDAMKPERDRDAARAMAAQMKLRREREATNALKDQEVKRLATLAKTARLRAARLALAADAQPEQPLRAGPIQRGTRSPLKV